MAALHRQRCLSLMGRARRGILHSNSRLQRPRHPVLAEMEKAPELGSPRSRSQQPLLSCDPVRRASRQRLLFHTGARPAVLYYCRSVGIPTCARNNSSCVTPFPAKSERNGQQRARSVGERIRYDTVVFRSHVQCAARRSVATALLPPFFWLAKSGSARSAPTVCLSVLEAKDVLPP